MRWLIVRWLLSAFFELAARWPWLARRLLRFGYRRLSKERRALLLREARRILEDEDREGQ